jgi:hypothetical protein
MIDSFLEDLCDQSYRDLGYIHEDEIPDIDKIKNHMKNVMRCMYETGHVQKMECLLHEICNELLIKVKSSRVLIEKREQSENISWYSGYQRAIIDSQNNKKQVTKKVTK